MQTVFHNVKCYKTWNKSINAYINMFCFSRNQKGACWVGFQHLIHNVNVIRHERNLVMQTFNS